MKKSTIILGLAALLLLAGCGSQTKEATETEKKILKLLVIKYQSTHWKQPRQRWKKKATNLNL